MIDFDVLGQFLIDSLWYPLQYVTGLIVLLIVLILALGAVSAFARDI
jgi:hypothetical protein